MNKKDFIILLLLLLGLGLTNLWYMFPNKEVNWFLWSDRVQSIRWYIFDTTEMLRISTLYYILYTIARSSIIRTVSLIIFVYSLVRILAYWLYFTGTEIPLTIVVIVTVGVLLAHLKLKALS